MSTPTEEEIRAALARAWTAPRNPITFNASAESGIDNAVSALMSLHDGLHDWGDMRQTETDRLDVIMEEEFCSVSEMIAAASVAAIEAIVRAELRFWSEFPDAPRAVREPVPA